MQTASAAAASASSTRRGTGSLTGLGVEQDHDCAAAAVRRTRLDESDHLVAPGEELAHAVLEDGLAPRGAQPLAVHDAHAPQSQAPAFGEELRRRGGRLLGGEAMQVEIVLDHPVRAPELAQDLARQSGAKVRGIALDLCIVVQRCSRELVQHRALILETLGGNRRGRAAIGLDAVGRGDGPSVFHGIAKDAVLVALLHARLSRYLSASSAAMQPVPALVTAWR